MADYRDIKRLCYEANLQLPELGLVLFTFGNASAADQKRKVFAIKPSGVPYRDLTADDMVVVDFDGEIVEGDLRPSSDTLTHAVLYSAWPEVKGIVHTHSTFATAWAQAQRDIPIMGTTHADHLTVDIPCAPPMSDDRISGEYERETGHQILDEMKARRLDYRQVEMMLVGNHAPFTWGTSVSKAVYHAAVLEQCAQMAWISLSINPNAPRLKETLIKKHYERKHGPEAYYGQ